jgi:GntR family transcriptional regulator
VDDEPIALGRSYLPAALAGLSREDAERRPTYAILTALTGLDIARASVAVGAEAADRELADILKVQKDAALLVMERISYFPNDACAERSTFHVRPERYRFVLSSSFPKGDRRPRVLQEGQPPQ